MAMKQANAAQKQWMNDIAEWAYNNLHLMFGIRYLNDNFQLHHVLGRSAKQDKVSIGHWFILPIPFDLHDVSSNHPENVTHRKKDFVKRFGNQRDLFCIILESMRDEGYSLLEETFDVFNIVEGIVSMKMKLGY